MDNVSAANNLKLPIALVLAMAAQLAGGVWWVSQQAATIANLEETVSQIGSKMAIEDNVNLKRDVVDNSKELEYVWDDMDELWEEVNSMSMSIMRIVELQQRVALLEKTLEFIDRDHNSLLDPRKMDMK
jgi:hypothetical protein